MNDWVLTSWAETTGKSCKLRHMDEHQHVNKCSLACEHLSLSQFNSMCFVSARGGMLLHVFMSISQTTISKRLSPTDMDLWSPHRQLHTLYTLLFHALCRSSSRSLVQFSGRTVYVWLVRGTTLKTRPPPHLTSNSVGNGAIYLNTHLAQSPFIFVCDPEYFSNYLKFVADTFWWVSTLVYFYWPNPRTRLNILIDIEKSPPACLKKYYKM